MKRTGASDSLPITRTVDFTRQKVTLSYHATDVPAVKSEPFSPLLMDNASYISILNTFMRVSGVSRRAPSAWKDVADEFRGMRMTESNAGSRDVQKLVDSLTTNCSTNKERLCAINNYLVSTFKRDPAAYYEMNPLMMLRHKNGTSFDITSLAEQMISKLHVKLPIPACSPC